MSKLITISVPDSWKVKEDELLKGDNLDFLNELEEVLNENDLFTHTFKIGNVITVDSEDFMGNCVVTLDSAEGVVFLLQEDTDIPYGKAIKVEDIEKNISLEEMDSIVGHTSYYW